MTGHKADIGIIGGSGLYAMADLTDVVELELDTPFGKPSDHLVLGTLEGRRVAFVPRHARGHRLSPSELNYQANVFALKRLGVQWILSVSAVGSLKEPYAPEHMLIPDQLVDRTRQRKGTFFGRGLVAHVAFAHPYCAHLSGVLQQACQATGVTHHMGGTYICIEGPQFSTRAESELYRSWGMDVIGMTNMQEARLAREAEICLATLAMITDYDCWHPEHDAVTAEAVIATLGANAARAQAVVRRAVALLDSAATRTCPCASALKDALVTPAELVPADIKHELQPLIGKYMS